MHSRIRLAVAGAVSGLFVSVMVGGIASPARADDADYQRGYDLGLEAYRYGLPLVTTDKTFRNQTSIDVSNGRGFGPVNQFNPVRSFITPEDRSVVAPNLDTLYSVAWLDLSDGPQVIHIPRIPGRYYVVPLMSPYTENFANLGSVDRTPPGDYAVVGPDDADVPLPRRVTRVESPYDRVWIIQRVYADNASARDQKRVNRIQDGVTVTSLATYERPGCKPGSLGVRLTHGKRCKPPVPTNPDTTVDNPPLPGGMDFFDRLSALLSEFPPPAADRAVMDKLAEIGIEPGSQPSTDASLDADTIAGMKAAAAAGPAKVLGDAQALYSQGFAKHNGYLVTPTGSYGTDYRLRGVVTQVGLGALRPEQSLYPLALLDRTGSPLTGAKKYVVHIPADGLPPIDKQGFWSLTMYDNDGFLVSNSANRYVINDRSALHRNADGSIDLFIQTAKPSDPQQAQNWLPAPTGGFRVLWRIYAASASAIPGVLDGTGWRAPAILPAD